MTTLLRIADTNRRRHAYHQEQARKRDTDLLDLLRHDPAADPRILAALEAKIYADA